MRVTPQAVALALVATVAAAWTIREADGMWDMPGTMGYEFVPFLGMWATMMAAMMLPTVAPFASMYARSMRQQRFPRLLLFAAGYFVVWALMGVPAYALALLADEYAGATAGTILAAGIFATCGLYQLTPLRNSAWHTVVRPSATSCISPRSRGQSGICAQASNTGSSAPLVAGV